MFVPNLPICNLCACIVDARFRPHHNVRMNSIIIFYIFIKERISIHFHWLPLALAHRKPISPTLFFVKEEVRIVKSEEAKRRVRSQCIRIAQTIQFYGIIYYII